MNIMLGRLTPVKFYPYAHSVLDRLLYMDNLPEDEYNDLRASLVILFNNRPPKVTPPATEDNKTVFEVEIVSNKQHVFIGFYDGVIHIGFGVQ
jgi:hypothetical protein